MTGEDITSRNKGYRNLCVRRTEDGWCMETKCTIKCDARPHPCPDYKMGTKLVKGVNAIQVFCPKCEYWQLVPKYGSKACKACGYTRTSNKKEGE